MDGLSKTNLLIILREPINLGSLFIFNIFITSHKIAQTYIYSSRLFIRFSTHPKILWFAKRDSYKVERKNNWIKDKWVSKGNIKTIKTQWWNKREI